MTKKVSIDWSLKEVCRQWEGNVVHIPRVFLTDGTRRCRCNGSIRGRVLSVEEIDTKSIPVEHNGEARFVMVVTDLDNHDEDCDPIRVPLRVGPDNRLVFNR